MSDNFVVVNVYQLPKIGRDFILEGKRLLRKNAKMTVSFVKEQKDKWKESGRLYEIQEKETKEFRENWALNQEIKREEKAAKEAIKDGVLNSLGGIVNEVKSKRTRKTKTE